ncbi:MAG: glycosyltransferase family A protein [archaeon]
MKKRDILVSIIIPAHNEERYIKKTLLSVSKQSSKNIETIVVDDCSTDNTVKVAKKYADIIIKLKKRGGVCHARNIGARKAKGSLLIFLDADTILFGKNLIEEIIIQINKGFQHGTCKMMPEKAMNPDHVIYSEIKNFFIKNTKFKASNGILFIKKDIHKKIGGFDEKKDKEEIFEYLIKADKQGKFKFIESGVIPSMRRGCAKTALYWMGIKSGLLRNKPYPVVR